MRGVETVLFLVIVATVVATFARRLRVPAPSLLVVVGVVVGLLPGVPAVQVTPANSPPRDGAVTSRRPERAPAC